MRGRASDGSRCSHRFVGVRVRVRVSVSVRVRRRGSYP